MKKEKENKEEKGQETVNETSASAENQTDAAKEAETDGEGAKEASDDSASKIEELEKEVADLKNQLLYKEADFQNYRKRALKEKQDAFDYGNESLLKDLLDSLDNFDRTVEAAASATDPKAIADGVKMISKNLVSMLENKYNLSSYGEVKDAFDPELHEAIGMQEADVKKEELGAVYLKGYKLKDKVIRHAKVMVNKPKA